MQAKFKIWFPPVVRDPEGFPLGPELVAEGSGPEREAGRRADPSTSSGQVVFLRVLLMVSLSNHCSFYRCGSPIPSAFGGATGQAVAFPVWCPRQEPRTRFATLIGTGLVEPDPAAALALGRNFTPPLLPVSAYVPRPCPRQESNLHHKLRKLAFYPLNYEGRGQDRMLILVGASCKSGGARLGHPAERDILSLVRLPEHYRIHFGGYYEGRNLRRSHTSIGIARFPGNAAGAQGRYSSLSRRARASEVGSSSRSRSSLRNLRRWFRTATGLVSPRGMLTRGSSDPLGTR